MASAPQGDGLIVGINVTPMVDIMLVLLIIFIVTAKIIVTPAVPMDLPEASHTEQVQVVMSVIVPVSGVTLVDGEPATTPAELTRLPAPKPGVRSPQPQGVGVHGAVEVGPRTAAMVRLEALGVARVRLVGGARERLRFHRVSGEGGTAWAAALEGPIELTPGTWLLEQPPGGPSYWLVTAPRAAEVVIETVAPRTGDLIWEHAIGAVLAWIEDGGDTPPLPAVVGAEETRRELEADAQIATEIERLDPRDPSLRRAVVAWRQASAIQMIEALRRPIRPAFALELAYRALAGATWLKGQAGWQRVRGPQTAVWTLTGPGVLWVEARSVGVAGEGSITVHAAGRRLGHAALLRPIAEQQEDVPEDLAPRTGEKTGDARSGEPKPEAPASLGGGRNSEDTDLGAGAADGAGIGDRFLGHVERTRVLLHLVDAAGEDPVEAWRVVRGELEAYGAGLEDKPEVLALSRTDLLSAAEIKKIEKKLAKASGTAPFIISAATGAGIEPLLDAILDKVTGEKASEIEEVHEGEWSPL